MNTRDGEAHGHDQPQSWSVEIWTDESGRSPFLKWFGGLPSHEQAVVDAVIQEVLIPLGINICQTEWGKPLKDGLYEIRIRKLPTPSHTNLHRLQPTDDPLQPHRQVLLRIFCTFYGDQVVLLFHGYNKGKDPSKRRQEREIRTARKYLQAWKRTR